VSAAEYDPPLPGRLARQEQRIGHGREDGRRDLGRGRRRHVMGIVGRRTAGTREYGDGYRAAHTNQTAELHDHPHPSATAWVCRVARPAHRAISVPTGLRPGYLAYALHAGGKPRA